MIAKTWIEEHIPNGARIMAEGYIFTTPTHGPPLVENPATLERDVALVQGRKGTGGMVRLRLTHYSDLYDGTKAYDILKVSHLDSEAIVRHSPHYLLMTSDKDPPAAQELASMFASRDDGERRNAVKQSIQSKYIIMATIVPTVQFTSLFPYLMDEDYRLIRNWPFFSSGRLRGPVITIWAMRSVMAERM
jgi:hypothetical protein